MTDVVRFRPRPVGRLLALPVLLVVLAQPASSAAQSCVGDCDGDVLVLINELILGVNIALGVEPVSSCPSLADNTGMVTISQLIRAVSHALTSCPATPSVTPSATPAPPTPTPSSSASATRSATATASATIASPTIALPATNTATATATSTATMMASAATSTETATATPTETPTSGQGVCGDGVVELDQGETCDDGNTDDGDNCPASCRVATCAGPPQGTVAVELQFATMPADLVMGGLTLFLRYPEDRIAIPGSDNDAAVLERISSDVFSVTPNDLNYALRTVLIDPSLSGIGAGTAMTVEFDICAGAAVPVARDFACTVEDASSFDDQGVPVPVTDQVTCSIRVQPPELPLVCGDGIVNIAGGETCDDGNLLDGDACPSTCRIESCAGPTQGQVTVRADFAGMPANLAVAGMTLELDYPEGRVTLPGASGDAAVLERVTSPVGFAVIPNDRDYALRAVLLDTLLHGITSGTALSIEFDICAGAVVPLARDFACTVIDAIALDDMGLPIDASDQITCTISVQPAELPLVCGDGIVNLAGGETCDDGNVIDGDACPSTCRIEPCEPSGAAPITAIVMFSTDPDVLVSGMTLFIEYPEGAVALPGSGNDAAVQARVLSTSFGVTPNDFDYALRVVLVDPTFAGVADGTALTIEIDPCQGPPPSPGAFSCTVLDAADVDLAPITNQVACEVTLIG